MTVAEIHPAPVAAIRDGLENIATGQGLRNDSRAHGYRTFRHRKRSYQELLDMYLSSWMCAQVVEIPAFEMTREWRTFNIEDSGKVDRITEANERVGLVEKVRETIQWSRLFGGGAILMGIDGTGELDEPLDLNRVKEDSLQWLHALDARSLYPMAGEDVTMVMDPTSPHFLQPEFYQVASSTLSRIHCSRIVKFPGIVLPFLEMPRYLWWGAPTIERSFDAIADAETVIGGVAELVTEAKVDVYSIPNLMNLVSTPDGEARVQKRIALANRIKSTYQAIIKDAGEDYDQKQNAIVQGMGGLIEQYVVLISGASGIPVTKLLGTSAKGMSATGEGDLTNFYDMVSSQQENFLRPRLSQLDQVFIRSACGCEPKDMPWTFDDLWQMSETETAELENKRANTAKVYLDAGVVDEIVIAKQLKEDGTYSAVDDDYITALEADIEELKNNPPPDPFATDPAAGPVKRDPAGNPIKPAEGDDPDDE